MMTTTKWARSAGSGFAAFAALAWSATAVGHRLDRRFVPRPAVEPPLTDGPLVSVVMPARNEAADIGAAVQSHLDQTYPRIEVIVVDDGSDDATADVARAAGGGDTRLRVIDGLPLPDGWVGKSWACHQGAAEAFGDWLLFSDADVVHEPETLARCLALALRLDRGGLTLAPRIEMGTVAERVVLPAAAYIISAVMAPGPLARWQRSPVTMAAGAYLLIRKDVYDGLGGHAGIGHHMVDDLALAREVKRRGGLLVPADGTDLIHLRMYRGTRAMWAGWRKNAAFASPRGITRGLAPSGLLGALALAPTVATVRGAATRDRRLSALGATALAAQLWAQRQAGGIAPTPRRYAVTMPLGTLFMATVAARGAVDRLTGRGPVWRGRRYPHAAGRLRSTPTS